MKRSWYIISSAPRSLGALLFLSLIASIAGCSDTSEDSDGAGNERPAQPVLTAEVEYDVENTFVEAIGTSRALRSVELESSVTGEVSEVAISAGERVEQGQVLVRLDDRDERLAVELAEVELADAERLLDRYKRSAGSGGVTQSDLDTAKSEVDRARIALERAKVELDHHTIKAPFSGHVGMTDVDPGAWIGPDSVITTLDDRTTLLVRFQLPELLFGRLQAGDTIQMSTWSDSFSLAEGEIVDVDSRIDETRRTFTVRAHVDNAADNLRPGMSFRVQMTLSGNRYPRVPEISLQWGGEGAYVWIVEEGKAKRVMVNIVQRGADGVLVDADFPDNAHIVTEGVHTVREGARVRPLNAELETAQAGDES